MTDSIKASLISHLKCFQEHLNYFHNITKLPNEPPCWSALMSASRPQGQPSEVHQIRCSQKQSACQACDSGEAVHCGASMTDPVELYLNQSWNMVG